MDLKTCSDTVSCRINSAIVSLGKSRASIASAADISRTTFNRRLEGDGDFTLVELARIARALNVSPSVLLPDSFRDVA